MAQVLNKGFNVAPQAIIRVERTEMDRNQIEQWARECALDADELALHQLTRFAALVAAHEREACIEACKAEHLEDPQDREDDAYDQGVFDCAAAIRKRSVREPHGAVVAGLTVGKVNS